MTRVRACVLVMLGLLGVGACGGSKDRATAWSELDPAAASTLVREQVDGCGSFARVLGELSRSGMSGRLLQGLVDDAVVAARERCTDPLAAITGAGAAQQLARSRWADDRPAEALAALAALAAHDLAIRFRRAELLDRLGRLPEALAELDAALAIAPDEPGRVLQRSLRV
ncbi:MAG: tetratricopeptide repeat protein, partial [Deltaproteobacteria bacterium]|nr:tetratricopeptide repeat protein [Deltaproteobacteria bacterium]